MKILPSQQHDALITCRGLLEQGIELLNSILRAHGIDPAAKQLVNTVEPAWGYEIISLLEDMPGYHTKAEITEAMTVRLKNYNLNYATVKNKVASELQLNIRILKKKVGNTFKYTLKKQRTQKKNSRKN